MKEKLSLSNQILIISLFSIVWILLYKLVFLEIDEVFPKASQIGEIFYGINASIIASSIFYYIVVYIPAKQRLDKVKSYITQRVSRFELDKIMILKDLYEYQGLKVSQTLPSKWEDFKTICSGIKLTDKAPIIFGNPSYQPKDWFEYFDYYFAIEYSNKEMLMNYWEDVPIEVKTLIEDMMTNTFHSGINTYKQGYSNELENLAGPLWNHLNILTEIPKVLKQTLKV